MEITQEEMRIIAQRRFEKTFCWCGTDFDITSVEKFMKMIDEDYSWTKDNLLKSMYPFHLIKFDTLPKSTKRKLLMNVAMIFSNAGYKVDTSVVANVL